MLTKSEWPDASCGSASDFFTCSSGDSFWGCCKSNPCAATPPATCAQGDLVPAFMERPEQFNAYANATSTASATSTPQLASKSNTGAIAGGVVGGVVGLAIIGALIFFFLRKKRRAQRTKVDEMGAAGVPMMNEKPGARSSTQYGGQSPPPTYSAPQQEYYQDMDPTKNHYQQRYANIADGPQELPGDISSPTEHRISELPAEASSSMASHRYSELPVGATRLSELESPQISPRPVQSEFSTDLAKQTNQEQGLGVTTEEEVRKN
ncbi:Nn.00g037350.m01.CDS01 [Neocucurbitaria sp. VM-36]